MPPRNRIKNNGRCRAAALLFLCLASLFDAQPAEAASFADPRTITLTGAGYEICPNQDVNGIPLGGITRRVVTCVREYVLGTANLFLSQFSPYLAGTIAVAVLLAVVFWGGTMTLGKNTAPVRDLAVLAIKVGAVMLFTTGFGSAAFAGGLFPWMIDIIDWMLGAVTSMGGLVVPAQCSYLETIGMVPGGYFAGVPAHYAVWDRIDCVLEMLVGGIFSPFTIVSGIIGLIVSAAFSNVIGIFIALLLVLLIVQVIFAIMRCVYIYLTSMMALALMVMVSPLFIPLILFKTTFGYFEKWLKITMGFMLQPIFLFAYLSMLLIAFDTVVFTGSTSLYRSIWRDGNWSGWDISAPWFRMGDSLLAMGAFGEESTGQVGVGVDWNRIKENLPLDNVDTGTTGVVAEHLATANWNFDAFDQALQPSKFLKMDVPVKTVSWWWLACINNFCNPDTGANNDGDFIEYMLGIVLAAIMAVIVAYIMLQLLDYLPFIGAGISGDTLSMPAFGEGRLSMPGTGLLNKAKQAVNEGITGVR